MKSFNSLTAIVLVAIGSTVWADDPAPVESVPQGEAQQYVEAEQHGTVDGAYYPPVTKGAHADFPGYYPGYSSYRGMGCMGSCCEQTSCCAQNAWDGYCEPKGCGHKSLFHGWKDKLHGCLPKMYCPTVCCPPVKGCDVGCGQKSYDVGCDQKGYPEPTCCDAKPWHGLFGKLGCGLHRTDCCDPCGDPCCEEVGGKYGAVAPTWHGKLHHKLHGLRGHWGGLRHEAPADAYGECCEPVQGKGMWLPANEQYQHVAPTPEPSTESNDEPTAEPSDLLPPPTVSTDFVPEFPDINTQNRSASRYELRRLPNAFMSY